MSTNNFTVPESWDKVDHTWLSSVIKRPISPDNFKLVPNAQAGSGYLSHIVRLSCVAADNNEQLNIIIKLMPAGDENALNLCNVIITEGLDVAEINFYEQVAPRLIAENDQLADCFPKFHAGFVVEEPKRDSVIMMEDLKPQGYFTYTFAMEMPMARVEEAVRFLSLLHHTADAIVHKEKKSLKQFWPFLNDGIVKGPVEDSSIYAYILDGYSKLGAFFEEQGVADELWTYYERLDDKRKEAFKTVLAVQNDHTTLLHNDLWSNNLLVPDSEDKPLKYIDWQLLGRGNPEYDLAVVIVSCLPMGQLTRENAERLIDIYIDSYYELCDQKGLPELKARRPRDEFKKFFFTYGMGFMFIWFTFATFPFATNFPRLLNIYRFLKNVNVVESFLSLTP